MPTRYLSILALTMIIIVSCKKENQAPIADFTMNPASGNDETIFMFDASGTADMEDSPEELNIIWDWEGDDHFDTQYGTRKTREHRFKTPGDYLVTLVVKDSRGLTDTLTKPLTVLSSNLPPEIPENPFPADGQTGLAVKLNMKWECTDPDGDIILYTVYFGTSNPPPLYETNHTYLGLDPEKLEYGTKYYWKLDAREIKSNTVEGPTWSFTTIDLKFGSMTDSRDGHIYTTIEVGTDWWMAENLNFASSGSYCYDGDADKCQRYGRLYNWNAAMKACPDGWHLPSKEEFENLIDHFGGADVAGGLLKDYETKFWRDPNTGASNLSGFGALPAGRRYDQGLSAGAGYYAQFYSSTEYQNQEAYNLTLGYDYQSAYIYNYKKVYSISVRCIKD
ncbi:MAG: PKD domain-containing protein [Bacteroidetes bacterium]|nr:PKD domain-containing protein [Bacteroidota bacterium]